MMRRRWIWFVVFLIIGAGLSFGQGPLTNALNVMVRTDSNGSLLVYGVAVGAQGPLRNLGNTMLRTYAPGSLAVTIAGGTVTPDVICLDGTNQDTCVRRVGADILAIRNGTVDQELQIGPATSYLDLIKINGSVAAVRTFDAQSLYLGVNNSNKWSIDGATGNLYDLGNHQIAVGGLTQFRSDAQLEARSVDPILSCFQTTNPGTTVHECGFVAGGYDSAGTIRSTGSLSFKWGNATAATGYGAVRLSPRGAGGTTAPIVLKMWGNGTNGSAEFFSQDQDAGVTANTVLVNGGMTAGFFGSTASSVLTIASNTIAPTGMLHHVGAGLIKTITVPATCTVTCFINLVPDAAYTYDGTGNILVPAGGGTALINKVMTLTWDGAHWIPSY